jgi:hypothetical protein
MWYIVRAVVLSLALMGRAYAALSSTSSPSDEERSVTLLGDAAAAAGDTTKGAAGIGVEVAKPTWLVSGLIKAGATGSLTSNNPKDFWGELLFPIGGSASVTLDANLYLSRLISKEEEWKKSPLKWGLRAHAVASRTNWAITAGNDGTSDSINLFAYGFGLTGRYDITKDFVLDRDTYDLGFEGAALFSGRTFSGDGAFVFANTEKNAPNFVGAELEFAIVINKVRAFAQMPILNRGVPGISGVNLVFGIGVRGDLVKLP